MTKQRFACLTWFRAFGTILILFCHCVCQSENSFLVASSQLLNIGNSIFFIMSGFIFGFQGAIKQPIYKWYARRFKRIYLPYELMLFVLFIISIICNIPINLKQWILQIIGLQGWNGVYGAAQTWFITSILLCYFFTPLISDITFGTKEKKNSCRKEILILCCIPFLLAYLLDSVVDTEIFMPICWYSISYVVGANYERINIKKQTAIIAFLLMCAGFVLRFCAKLVFDDTIFYNNIVVGFTQTFGAFCLFYIFAAFSNKNKVPLIISEFSKCSYEIYLWHYMFTNGPLKLFGLTPYWVLDCILVFVVSIVVALISNKFLEILKRTLTRKDCKVH